MKWKHVPAAMAIIIACLILIVLHWPISWLNDVLDKGIDALIKRGELLKTKP